VKKVMGKLELEDWGYGVQAPPGSIFRRKTRIYTINYSINRKKEEEYNLNYSQDLLTR